MGVGEDQGGGVREGDADGGEPGVERGFVGGEAKAGVEHRPGGVAVVDEVDVGRAQGERQREGDAPEAGLYLLRLIVRLTKG